MLDTQQLALKAISTTISASIKFEVSYISGGGESGWWFSARDEREELRYSEESLKRENILFDQQMALAYWKSYVRA